jgi:hypothetical protein
MGSCGKTCLGHFAVRYVQEAGRDLIRAQLSHSTNTTAEQKSVIASGLAAMVGAGQ